MYPPVIGASTAHVLYIGLKAKQSPRYTGLATYPHSVMSSPVLDGSNVTDPSLDVYEPEDMEADNVQRATVRMIIILDFLST